MPAPTNITPNRGLLARAVGAPRWVFAAGAFAVGAVVLGLLTAGLPPAAGVLALRLVRSEGRWVPATVLAGPSDAGASLTPDALEARVVVTFNRAPGWLQLRARPTPTPIPPKADAPAVASPPPPPAELYALWATLAETGDPATAGTRTALSPADQGLILRALAQGRTTAFRGAAASWAYGLGLIACLIGFGLSLTRMALAAFAADDAPDV